MDLEQNDILMVSNLAKIELNSDDQKHLCEKLNDLLKVFETLNDVDTTNVNAMSHPIENTFQFQRNDVVTAKIDYKYLQENAPETEAGLYLVPAVIE